MVESGLTKSGRRISYLNAFAMHWHRAIVASVAIAFALMAALSPALPISAPTTGAVVTTTDNASSQPQFAVLPEWASEIPSRVGELRQLDCESVPVQLMNRDELREMLIQDSEDDLNETDTTQELLILLDLLDEGQSLRDVMVEAYSEQIAGFYDPDTGELYLISETSDLGPFDELTLAHEYAHAIQDQHFDLTSLDEQGDDSEASFAKDALVEGDATVVMALYFWQYFDEEEQAAIGEMSSDPTMELDEDVPAIIQETMMFPYEYGMQFVIALIEEGRWEAVNEAYGDPPESTEQIMHPEKYIRNRDEPIAVTLPDVASALGSDWSEVDSDVFGEFSLKLYLEAFLDESQAENAAAGWGGDRYTFLENSAGQKAFALKSEWDTADDAREFYEACVDRAREKSGSGKLGNVDGSKASSQWESEGLSYRFALDEGRVYLVIAPDAKTADKAMAAASGSAKSSNVWMYVGLGIGLACLICILGLVLLLFRRRRNLRLALESVISQGGPSP